MTAADVDAFPSSRPIAPRRLPRRAVIVALVALALAVAAAAGWLGVRSRVDLQLTGSSLTGFGAEAGSAVAEDPAPGTAVAVYVVRNAGPVPGTNPGVATGPTAVALDVRALGITRQVLLHLDPAPMIRSTVAIPSSC